MPSVDFAAVRRAIPIERVLELLRFQAAARCGNQLRGPCPLHGSERASSSSFSVNVNNNAFRCFVCGRAGNQPDLWGAAQELSLYEAAVDLCRRLDVPLPTLRTAAAPEQRRGTRKGLVRP